MSKHATGHVPMIHILEGSYLDPATDAMEVPLSWGAYPSGSRDNRKPNQVVPHDVIEIDEDDDEDEVVVIGECLSDRKYRQTMKNVNGNKNAIKNPILIIGDEMDVKYQASKQFDTVRDCSDHHFNRPEILKITPNPILIIEDEMDVKCQAFKQFDTVRDCSDHHFNRPEILKITPARKEPAKDWVKRIQHEWKVLEKDLPETIYVRIYEDRMDILRAVIIGPAGTPYHDGLFFFDIYFPPTFPLVPPMVHYHSGGLRLNPNLYQCGKVCLSLLNTWPGQGCETWNSSNSTILQVLVSIQALVLNAKPYFNEPGFAHSVNTTHGRMASLAYNETTFILSCKTMLYSLRKPPKHFEDFVAEHFRIKGGEILEACRAYIRGAQVGCIFINGVQVDKGEKSSSSTFKENLSTVYDKLVMEFTAKGALTDKPLQPQ